MTTTAAKTAVQAFICYRQDYCNSMLYGMSDALLRKVQSTKNAAACLVTGAQRCDHSSSERSERFVRFEPNVRSERVRYFSERETNVQALKRLINLIAVK